MSRTTAANDRKYNVLMILTDQEQSLASWPEGLLDKLPGHRALLERGLLIENYHVQTTPCSPSRSTIFTGQHTQTTGVYQNTDTPPNPGLSDTLPTLGTMMQAAGYYSSYKGKWHLSQINRERDWNQVPRGLYPNTEKAMEKYGFHDYGFDGEAVGLTWDGYRSDAFTAADVGRTLFDYARHDKAGGKPWFQVVGLVNPHDIMFYDATGKQSEDRLHPDLLAPLRREPGDPIYETDNGFDLPESFYKDDLGTKPEAHSGIVRQTDSFYGRIERTDEASWRRLVNYYYNCIRDVDRRLEQILWALTESGQMESTIIVYTSDHGERASAHGMHQKAGTVYREEVNVPMIIVHPDLPGGRRTKRLMSAIDIAPTLMGLAGMAPEEAEAQFPGLPGVDLSAMIADPSQPSERDARGHLFDYAVAYMWEPLGAFANYPKGVDGLDKVFDLTKRRLHRGVHDGRWKFARYFAPSQHHTPEDWETLSRLNDLELYDTEADPNELVNLAHDPAQRDNIMRLNAMVNDLVAREVGRDDGREYPGDAAIYNQVA
ncbi:arylsulfatase [Parvibaculum indicum]|uniref:sulfatase-like hydrolase/transferase n=1 Tax=Parvibaculum indicum TaxID=562969 RepID=UPI0014248EDE|nr:sulfatase-like hydrolase/transferase [Parvibaculum indicum]NIJ41192.1 arylsulfatase [Parvibaculum indicum]